MKCMIVVEDCTIISCLALDGFGWIFNLKRILTSPRPPDPSSSSSSIYISSLAVLCGWLMDVDVANEASDEDGVIGTVVDGATDDNGVSIF